MKIGITIDKTLQRALEKKLKTLPEKVFRKHVGKSAGKAMTPVARDARSRVPKETGALRKSIGKRKRTYSRQKTVFVAVGPRAGKEHASIAHLVEFGHRMVTGGTVTRKDGRLRGSAKNKLRTGKGRAVGFVPGRPFLRPALEQNKENVLRTYRFNLVPGILQEARAK